MFDGYTCSDAGIIIFVSVCPVKPSGYRKKNKLTLKMRVEHHLSHLKQVTVNMDFGCLPPCWQPDQHRWRTDFTHVFSLEDIPHAHQEFQSDHKACWVIAWKEWHVLNTLEWQSCGNISREKSYVCLRLSILFYFVSGARRHLKNFCV